MELAAISPLGSTADPADTANNVKRQIMDVVRDLQQAVTMSPDLPLLRLERLCRSGKIDSAIDEGLDVVNRLLVEGAFDDVDGMLAGVDCTTLDPDVVVALLTASFPARHRLSQRQSTIDRLETVLLSSDPEEDVQTLVANLRG